MTVLEGYPWIAEKFAGVRSDGNRAYAICPLRCHSTARLRFWLGEAGNLLFGCYGGCNKLEILRAVGVSWPACYPDGKQPERPKQEITARYDYRDEAGATLYQTIRLEPGWNGREKDFRQRRPKAGGGWDWSLGDVRRVLYRLPELLKADAGETVFVVAGEKDVESLRALGLVATTNVCGERSPWLADYSAALAGRYVAVIPDRDGPGVRHADEVCGSLIRHGVAGLRLAELPGKDVTDYLRGLKAAGFVHPAALREAFWAAVSDRPQWVRGE